MFCLTHQWECVDSLKVVVKMEVHNVLFYTWDKVKGRDGQGEEEPVITKGQRWEWLPDLVLPAALRPQKCHKRINIGEEVKCSVHSTCQHAAPPLLRSSAPSLCLRLSICLCLSFLSLLLINAFPAQAHSQVLSQRHALAVLTFKTNSPGHTQGGNHTFVVY